MTYVDTNILARLMTNDLPDQSERAAKLVNACSASEIIIADAVLVELFFVLETRPQYNFSHQLIAGLFREIVVPTPQFRISEKSLEALDLYAQQPKLDFMDCLLAVSAEHRADRLLTFDKNLQKILH